MTMSTQARAWVYLGCTVVLVGLLLAGIISDDDVQSALGYIGTAIGLAGVGLATANTSIKSPPMEVPTDDED